MPSHSQLRYLKSADKEEAQELFALLKPLVTGITIEDFSAQFNDKAGVKPRTYELWVAPNSVTAANQ